MRQTYIYIIRCMLLLACMAAGGAATAQTYGFRYVSTAGDFNNDGLSWATAKNNLQNAIDELNDAVKAGTITQGYVYVAGSDTEDGMVYVPTRRSTDDADGSVFNMSFRVYAGISVYGGFRGDEVPTAEYDEKLLWKLRIMTNGNTYARVESEIDADNIGETVRRWNFKYKTVLSGNHSTNPFRFNFNETRGIYNTNFPLSSYHVVWFATNGKITPNADGDEKDLGGHFAPLSTQAVVDGCTIEGGNASSTNLNGHDHTGFGGGVYMVKNALLRNCTVHHCAATQRGGGVYLDGGGEVERCYIHTCQVSGYGMQQGYGGGVCIDYDGSVKHSYIIQSAARIGAGLAICHAPHEYPERTLYPDATNRATPYDPYASAVVVSNCTSNAEGGGVYLDEGGTLNHCSVVNNKCVGPDVIYYGRRHARTGGIYVKNRGTLYNTVAWGNLSPVNNDVQFASYKDENAEALGWRIAVYYCAFSKSDITDWATATKENVVSLTTNNTPEHKDDAGNFPIFEKPTAAAGIQYDPVTKEVDPTATGSGEPYQRVYNWHPLAASKLRQKGVQVNDALQGINAEVMHAHITTDIIGRKYEAIAAIGALAQSYRTKSLAPKLMESLEKGEEGQLIPTLLMDPNRTAYGPENNKEYDADGNLVDSAEPHAGYLDDNPTGECWEHPIGNLGNAIRTLRRRQWTKGEKKDWFNVGGTKVTDANGDVTFEGGTDYEHAQICVKEGSITTAGPDCYLGTQARTASLRPVSNLRIYAGFPKTNTGTRIDNRNQRQYPTKVTSDVLNDTYMNNGAHVFALINVHDVIIDGFRMYDGNANIAPEHSYAPIDPETGQREAITYGGGIIVNNSSVETAERHDMTGNIVRNCVIANCSAPDGAAIYVNGNNLKSDGTHARAELTVINCVIRNNTAGDMHGNHDWFVYKEDADYEDANEGADPEKNHRTESAVVTANGNAHIWLRNCDIMNNCGYALEGLNPTNSTEMFQVEIYNSIIFSNGQMIRSDRAGIIHPVTCNWNEQQSIIGNYIYIDWDAEKPPVPDDVKCFNYLTTERTRDRTYATNDGTIGGTPLSYTIDDGTHYATDDGTAGGTPILLHYPYFVNPSRNVGHSEEGDRPLYGGTISYEPLNMNPIVNGGCPDIEDDTGAADRLPAGGTVAKSGDKLVEDPSNVYNQNCKSMAYDAAWLPRTYGGAPDAGAVEDLRLPRGGTVIYVTPEGAGKRDGSSWSNAIQGNAVYQLDDVPGPALATGDMLDTTNGTDRVISSSGDASTAEAAVLTTDSKYCGGFGRVWFTDWKTGATSTTTVTQTWITERNVYVGGTRDGEVEVLQNGTTPTESSNTVNTDGTTQTGFTVGYHYDPRYPYGEISGQSRTFWRANPYTGTYNNKDAFIAAENTNGFISNTRAERYVSGLQYAVEKAAAYNALEEDDAQRLDGVDSVMVWVGNGKYTDYKGFIMRDNTTVMGSFPVTKGGTPGLSERQALMSDVISIPKSLPAQNLEAADYETILQISDTDPKQDNLTLNEDAVKYWDDDYSVVENANTQSYEYKNRSITHYYTLETDAKVERTSTYLSNYTFTTNTNPTLIKTEGGIKYYEFGSAPSGFDCWHMSYPNKTNFVVNVENNTNARKIYNPEDNSYIENYSGKRIFLSNGSLTGVEFWQTIPSLPAGEYQLNVDLAGGYRNKYSSTDPTNMYFKIVGSDGSTELVTPIMLKTIGSSTGNDDKDTNRNMAYRYTFDFTQSTAGSVTLKIVVEDGVRNTKAANATYYTDDGGDPDPIPDTYTSNYGGNNPNRREFWISNVKLYEIIRGTNYVETSTNDETTDRVVDDPEPTVVTSQNNYTLQTHRTTLRKRVLTMPDVCVPTYGGGGIGNPVTHATSFNDNLPHSDRVTGSAKDKRTATTQTKQEDPFYVAYDDVFWDGFTIRHGFLYDEAMTHGGGAGVNMYEGAHLQNCIVINNFAAGQRMKGGGIFCDGATSTVEGCFVLNNTSTRGTTNTESEYKQVFAGGMFMYEGTCFNSLFAKNHSFGSAGGVGFCVGRFYNNTIAYNTCDLVEGGHINGGAISIATSSNPNLFLANTIIYGNSGMAIRQRYDQTIGIDKVNPFIHCYVQSEVAFTQDLYLKNIGNHSDNSAYYGVGNVLLNGVAPSADNTPFAADIASGSYDASNPGAKEANDFRLTSELQDCINKGTEDFAGNLLTALIYKGKKENEIRNSFIYKSVEASVLPENDVAFARRVQDCQIDMGAYEFDGSKFIEPDLSEDGKAIFYVSQNGGGGLATASTVEDAACMVKLQKVLDAAGRWKYAANFYTNTDPAGEHYNMTNFTQSVLENEITIAARKRGFIAANASLSADAMATWLTGLKNRTVIVKLAGDYYRDKSGNYTPTFFKYAPTRSTVTDATLEENLLEYSFMVPRGVQVLGGYVAEAVDKNDGSGGQWLAFSDETRDALGNHTRLSGLVTNAESGATGNTFHVVTFVDDLYTPDEKLYTDGNGTQLKGQLATFSDEKDRAVLDGLYIQEGFANGTDAKDRRGGGAVVTDFAHIRNCIIQYNEAVGEGGGLYMQPRALVSGCIVKYNTAYAGGGIYVEEPATVSNSTYARIISSTVVFNTAQTVAGGLHFETNVRANSSAFWKNTANDLSNVAGTFSNGGVLQVEENCPFNYCGVESRRISGINNIELPVAEDQGVRWDHDDPHEVMRWNVYPVNRAVSTERADSVYYFPINLSSILGRAGMTYAAYEELRKTFPTMELTDMAGFNRMAQEDEGEQIRLADGTLVSKLVKNNSFIEMGARVLNGTFELHVSYEHVMTRLFVTTTQLLPSEAALKLQENTVGKEMASRGESYASGTPQYQLLEDDVEMYKQMGSTFLNPFHRLGDALEYIVRVRSSNEPFDSDGDDKNDTTVGDYYKNQRFEIFVSSGTFYPFRDAHGQQGEARANTFVVPEEVTIVGGCDRTADGHSYCQATTGTLTVAGYTLDCETTTKIRADRERMDRNGNHVKEPWELKEQTILSGNAVSNSGSDKTNVYHVVTCFPDETRVGKLPTRTDSDGNTLPALLKKYETVGDEQVEVTPSRIELLENLEAESRESRDKRTIFIDGLTITGGHANDIENDDIIDNFQKLTYFRGGGILVEGNWDNTFDQKTDLPEVLGVAKRDITLVTANCLFQDNTGGNGGAVYTNGTYYAFGCHFTKNTSCGPNTDIDQRYIPWTAGGAIANNYNVHVWNTLFDNNEAKRGKMEILSEMEDDEGHKYPNPVHDSDNRQGYAGAISCSETGLVRVSNCDFVRNKAVAFPAIYNFFDNNLRAYSGIVYDDYKKYEDTYPGHGDTMNGGLDGKPHGYAYFKKELDDYYYGKGHHFAVNSIFWGNEATGSEVHAASWQELGYYNWRESGYEIDFTDIPHDSKYYTESIGWTDNRKPGHIANFGPFLDISTLTFCAFEEGTGREGTVWYENHDRAKSAQITAGSYPDALSRLYAGDFLDVLYNDFGFYPAGEPERPIYQKVFNTSTGTYDKTPCAPDYADAWIVNKDDGTERRPNADEIRTAIAYNYNLVLDEGNIDPNGPYFVQPSLSAGEDGYMETADWLVSRLNRTVDTGWGMLRQQVTQASETSALLQTTLLKTDGKAVGAGDNQYTELWGEGFYNLHSKNIYQRFSPMGFPDLLAIGDERYMDYTTEGLNETSNMRRISTHPKMGVQDVFIDMGIYEYQYVQLITGGSETDVIWVAETEDPSQQPCNGSTWAKATSDLQGAIEMLLLSRNEHDKMIKIRSGNYHPMNMTDGNQRAFFIRVPSRNQGVLLPEGVITADNNFSARSLTIRGGYSNDYTANDNDGEATRDVEANPTVLEMVREAGSTDHMLEHLFIVEDAQKKSTYLNYLTTDNSDFEEYVIPIVFEGITFVNPYGNKHHEDGGAAIIYEEQYGTVGSNDDYHKDPTQLLKGAPIYDANGVMTDKTFPKLIIRECIFAANGKDSETSAVKISKGGGQSLIVNSLFHSNSAAPIDAVNTKVINCTFALNGGHVTLRDETEHYKNGTSATFTSALHNSLIWRDDLNAATPATAKAFEVLDNDGTPFTTGTSDRITHNAYTLAGSDPDGTTETDAQGNFQLSKVNDDVLLGPNFKDPAADLPANATTDDKLLRDFHVGPSAQVLNRADTETYLKNVPYTPSYPDYASNPPVDDTKDLPSSTLYAKERNILDGEGNVTGTYWFHSVQHGNPAKLTEAMMKGTNEGEGAYQERELAYKYRWLNAGVERGAYECTAQVERVLYVMDGAAGQQDGTTWEHAFNIDDLQTAVDVASVYSLTTSPQERAYVFVKASDTPAAALKLRDGVSVYGSIGGSFSDMVEKNLETSHYDDADIEAYIYKMQAQRNGVATRNVSHNTIGGLLSENNSVHHEGFLLDGFWISAGTTASTPVSMVKDNTVVRNTVITDCNVTGDGSPVVDLQKGLLYNTLLYGNSTASGAPVVSIGTNGYALNNTIVAYAAQTPIGIPDGAPAGFRAAHEQNNITSTESDGLMFAPYFRPRANHGNTALTTELPTYLTDHRPYWYQLHEESKEINAGTDNKATSEKDGGNSIARLFPNFVDFSYDRDLLGNPRRLGGQVDNGCFETWRIDGNKYVTNTTDGTYTLNYGGHLYPHPGSVTYVMGNANLVVNTDGDAPLFTASNALAPGYVLVKPGGSVYGQGNTLRLAYVAAERDHTAADKYALTAYPFAYDVRNAMTTTHNMPKTDELTQDTVGVEAYTYDGERRAAYNYDFKDAESDCWTSVTTVDPCEGWLTRFKSPAARTVRFTGWSPTQSDYAYTEDGSNKTVTLTQHNSNRTNASTSYPMFTKLEDMGWNLKGQPWLVSNFKTDGTNPHFNMDVPHLFYDMNGDGSYNYANKSNGQFYTKRSWDAGTTMGMGQAFFTQTAVIGTEETLTFKLPVYGDDAPSAPSSRQLVAAIDDNGYGDVMEVMPSEDADPVMPYRLGSDGVKWFAFSDAAPQLFLLNAGGTPLSLESAAPVETELPVGLRRGHSEHLTIVLPHPETFADYSHVWLTDHELGRVVDLLQESYDLTLSDEGYCTNRLTLRIGGPRPDDGQTLQAGYLIYTRHRRLFIEQLQPGDHIQVYNAGGALMEDCKATSSSYQRDLFSSGTYIVRVNSTVKKVLARP